MSDIDIETDGETVEVEYLPPQVGRLRVPRVKKCVICGRKFATYYPRQITCSKECSHKRGILVLRELRRAKRERITGIRTRTKKDLRALEIFDIEAQTRQEKARADLRARLAAHDATIVPVACTRSVVDGVRIERRGNVPTGGCAHYFTLIT